MEEILMIVGAAFILYLLICGLIWNCMAIFDKLY